MGITQADFEKFIKDIFSGSEKPKKRQFICSADFIQGYFDKYGKQGLIDFCNQVEACTGEEGYNLAMKLTK